jgi:hypothetical protein
MTAPRTAEAQANDVLTQAGQPPTSRATTRAVMAAFPVIVILAACTASQNSAPVNSLAPAVESSIGIAPSNPPPLPETIIGLDSDGLSAELGKPVFLMRAKAAEIWQYRAEGCVLDLYLYEESGAMRVLYLEARDSAGESQAPGICIAAIHAARERWPDSAGT